MAAIFQIKFFAYFSLHLAVNAVEHNSGQNIRHWHKNIDNVLQKWEFELDDKLVYPRGDKEKLNQISILWSKYYECSSRLGRIAAAASRLPAVAIATYEGAIARLPCGLCVSPDIDISVVQWIYQKQDSSFIPIIIDERMKIADNGNLTIFKVRKEDAGAYKCTIGQSAGGTVLLDVVDRGEPYNVVKPPTSRGPYPAEDQYMRFAYLSISMFTSWEPWSECSVCGHVGRRRRIGMCYVKSKNVEPSTAPELDIGTNTMKLFEDFPAGIPCRSRRLPVRIRNLPTVIKRRNEIMIGLCKVPCESVTVFEVRSTNGAVLERANNTAGVFSLSQRLPPEPPPPVYDTIFSVRGQKLILVCPGTSLRDIPVTWRVGTELLVPREADRSSGGRVHLNARDDIVFAAVAQDDANVYSCWHRNVLVGTVKLSVSPAFPWRRRATLLATLLAVALVLRSLDAVLRRQRRRAGT